MSSCSFSIDAWMNSWRKKIAGETIRIKFVGIDSWNRPVFKAINRDNFFVGDTCHLFAYHSTEKEVLNRYGDADLSKHLTYLGNHFDCEPEGLPLDTAKIEVVTEENGGDK
ncbi:MAG: hypothetical protein AB7F40_04545 [Victivallaceae bacterium]